jgi:hypothetical protein
VKTIAETTWLVGNNRYPARDFPTLTEAFHAVIDDIESEAIDLEGLANDDTVTLTAREADAKAAAALRRLVGLAERDNDAQADLMGMPYYTYTFEGPAGTYKFWVKPDSHNA